MSVQSQVTMWKVPSFVFLTLFILGCGKKEATQNSTVSAANSTPAVDPKKEEPLLPQTPIILTPEQIKEGQKQDKSFLVEKYGGQLVEVTGKAIYFGALKGKDPAGEVMIRAGVEEKASNAVAFQLATPEDLHKIKFSEDIITIRSTIPKNGEGRTPVWSVIKVTRK